MLDYQQIEACMFPSNKASNTAVNTVSLTVWRACWTRISFRVSEPDNFWTMSSTPNINTYTPTDRHLLANSIITSFDSSVVCWNNYYIITRSHELFHHAHLNYNGYNTFVAKETLQHNNITTVIQTQLTLKTLSRDNILTHLTTASICTSLASSNQPATHSLWSNSIVSNYSNGDDTTTHPQQITWSTLE